MPGHTVGVRSGVSSKDRIVSNNWLMNVTEASGCTEREMGHSKGKLSPHLWSESQSPATKG